MKFPLRIAPLVLLGGFAFAQDGDGAGLRFVMKRQPSVRIGDWLRVDFRAKVQTDLVGDSPAIDSADGIFDPRRLRIGIEGRITRDVEFELEYELLPTDYPVRDAFVNYRRIRHLQVKAGQFKVPFGMDQLTGPGNLDFVYRSRIGSELTPGRDKGVLLHGRFFEQGLKYEAGVFRHDGENAEAAGDIRTGGRTLAGRLTASPGLMLNAPSVLRGIGIGAAFTHSDVAEGLNGLRGQTITSETMFSRMYVRGARIRQGAELSWLLGSLSLKSEYINVRQQRREQSLLGTDLPDLVARGWYASATHPIFGGRKEANDSRLLKTWLPGAQTGLVEAAIRFEQIRFGSRASSSLPSRSPRAANVLPTSDRVLTLGVNWYANRYTKFQCNVMREYLEDPMRTPLSGVQRYWIFAARMQFVL
jgi:phosphate-selective porin